MGSWKILKALSLGCLGVMAAVSAPAQTRGTYKAAFSVAQPVKSRNYVALETFDVLMDGVGARYDHFFSDHFGAGAFINTYKIDGSSEGQALRSRVQRLGARGLLTLRHPSQGTGYAALALTQVEAKASGKGSLSGLSGEDSDSKTGTLLSAGYLFTGANLGSSRFLVNLAANYGEGNRLRLHTLDNKGTFNDKAYELTTEIESSLGFEVSVGLLF
ncbi:MAG: hypothetical protein KF802_03505 [Bdellovibrionaceae bacterium]|nr:hypothetical protein [Pseudobdellovibrionaceae bacterium]MBX3033312.1 hypothetical protein [Pseudobdellovibrionaceae bacterium]